MSNFTTWTVCPHKPIEKLAPNLWRVSGTMPARETQQRQMVLAKLKDGRVIVHNAIALEDKEMAELEAWGQPALIFVPNAYHRQDAAIWKQRYADAKVGTPKGARKRVEAALPVDVVSEEAPQDETVRLIPLDGLPGESVLEVKTEDGVTLVFCDAILNVPKLGFPMSFVLGPTGTVSTPRIVRWMALKDKKAFAAQLEKLADTPRLNRLLFGHGKPITEGASAALLAVVRQLRGG